MSFLPAILAGRLFDMGHFKAPVLIASCVIVVGTILTAQCTKYWQFLLCQGFAIGVGLFISLRFYRADNDFTAQIANGFIFGPVLAMISQWFLRRRATAYGIFAVGASIGGMLRSSHSMYLSLNGKS